MVIDILKNLRIYETKGSLYDSKHHIIIFVFVFKQKDNVNCIVEYVTHLLPVYIVCEEFFLSFDLLLLHYFDKRNYLCENTQN
jgi:hypothetical protein